MTISTQNGLLRITCNNCGFEAEDLATPAPAGVNAQTLARRNLASNAKSKGWLIRRAAGGWDHYCPHCTTRRSGDRTRQDRLL